MKSRGEIIGFIGHNFSAMGKTDPGSSLIACFGGIQYFFVENPLRKMVYSSCEREH
jgi:hypothetical protein